MISVLWCPQPGQGNADSCAPPRAIAAWISFEIHDEPAALDPEFKCCKKSLVNCCCHAARLSGHIWYFSTRIVDPVKGQNMFSRQNLLTGLTQPKPNESLEFVFASPFLSFEGTGPRLLSQNLRLQTRWLLPAQHHHRAAENTMCLP